MRKIDKSPHVPLTLQNAPIPTNAGEVKDAIYKANDVRKQLVADQYGKCAYCECSITKDYNDVEHYRPKSVYYWLGHEWSNLLYACNLCNRSYKKASFPLADETKRVSAPGDVSGEDPLIINPAEIEPSEHIKFKRHIAVALTPKGEETIKLFHLNDREKRPELVSNREQVFESYKLELDKISTAEKVLQQTDISLQTITLAKQIIEMCKQSIKVLKAPSGEYSGMLLAQW